MSKAIEKAYARIRADILSGALAAGQHLKEEELAERCGVSRTPVRDALRRLEVDEFVERRGNQRVFVRHLSVDDIDDLFDLRAVLEGYAAARAAARITPQQLAQLEEHHRAIVAGIDAIGAIHQDIFLGHNKAFHRIILDAADNRRLKDTLTRLVEQPVVVRTLVCYTPADLHRSTEQHGEVLEALRAGDSVWAQAVMTSHIHHARSVFRRSIQQVAAPDSLASAAE